MIRWKFDKNREYYSSLGILMDEYEDILIFQENHKLTRIYENYIEALEEGFEQGD